MQMNEQGSKNRVFITLIINSGNEYSEVTMQEEIFKAKVRSLLFSNNTNTWTAWKATEIIP